MKKKTACIMSILMTMLMFFTALSTMSTPVMAAQAAPKQTRSAVQKKSPAAQPAAKQTRPAVQKKSPAVQPAAKQTNTAKPVKRTVVQPALQNKPKENAYADLSAVSGNKNDTLQTIISESYGAHAMGMDKLKLFAKSYQVTKMVKVAVFDTSIVTQHQFFNGRIVKNRMGISAGSKWHGTVCAGVIADCTPKSVRIYGYRVNTKKPETIVKALKQAIHDGVQVISMSIALDSRNPYVPKIERLFKQAYNRNIVLVAAAANNRQSMKRVYPACSQYTYAVSALRQDNVRPGSIKYMRFDKRYSNFGNGISFSAPGTEVHTATNGAVNRCSYASGTSLATPHIASCFAYLKMFYPRKSNMQLFKIIKGYCVDLGSPGFDNYYGWGVPYIKNLVNEYRHQFDRKEVSVTSVRKRRGELTVKVRGINGASYTLYQRKVRNDRRGWRKIKTIRKGRKIQVSVDKGTQYEYIVLMKRGRHMYLSDYFRK